MAHELQLSGHLLKEQCAETLMLQIGGHGNEGNRDGGTGKQACCSFCQNQVRKPVCFAAEVRAQVHPFEVSLSDLQGPWQPDQTFAWGAVKAANPSTVPRDLGTYAALTVLQGKCRGSPG